MCTTGALRLSDGSYLLFKNKDFGRENFEDRLDVSKEAFGVVGTPTWDREDGSADVFSGYSIGANRYGLLCADSNVREEPSGGANYDLLTEVALLEGRDIGSAIRAVESTVQDGPYWCANFVLIDQQAIAGLEVRGSDISVELYDERHTRTNHHISFGATELDQDTTTSALRLRSSSSRLAEAKRLEDVLDLLSSHDDGGTGICSHSRFPTVYSYILHCRMGQTHILVSKGPPCSPVCQNKLLLPIGDDWSSAAEETFRSLYPSESAFFPAS
ncbi:MAG TPA: hypothetical protein DIT46_06140 [Gemmatimonadetes bacterium]|nr:hypothetical protein [Gemmatimonadota bacterium]|tara:strand:- start:131 stop:946 length:816 start_codon:yes stop_codon:yes gene_type:complete